MEGLVAFWAGLDFWAGRNCAKIAIIHLVSANGQAGGADFYC